MSDSLSDLRDQPTVWPSQRTRVTSGVLMDFVVDEVEVPQGESVVRNYLNHPNSVGIIAMDDRGRIAVEKQYRHPVRALLLEAPAGLVDPEDTDLESTARRELAEELALSANSWRILADTYATPGSSTQLTRIFLAQELKEIPRPPGFLLEAEEAHMEVGWAEIDDLLDGIFTGVIKNPTLVVGVLALRTAMATQGLDNLRVS